LSGLNWITVGKGGSATTRHLERLKRDAIGEGFSLFRGYLCWERSAERGRWTWAWSTDREGISKKDQGYEMDERTNERVWRWARGKRGSDR
jgi:hypothetical protein